MAGRSRCRVKPAKGLNSLLVSRWIPVRTYQNKGKRQMATKAEKRILIVEDSIDTRSLLAEFLRGEGYIVDCASNGHEAFEILRTPGKPLPGLILLDMMMPGMNGGEFRQAQEKDPKLANIPVVVMTAEGDCES